MDFAYQPSCCNRKKNQPKSKSEIKAIGGGKRRGRDKDQKWSSSSQGDERWRYIIDNPGSAEMARLEALTAATTVMLDESMYASSIGLILLGHT